MASERNPQGHTPNLLLTRADESVKRLKVISGENGQARIENCDGRFGSEFDAYYVAISGYCGHVNPHTFASAPELLAALEFMVNVSRTTPGFSPMAREQAERAIAKATGGAK